MDKATLINLIPPTIALIITSLFGLFVGVLIEKFKNRYRSINYSIVSQKVKPSLSQNLGGHLKINLGNREIDTLKVVTVEIENKSSIDIENIVIKFGLPQGITYHGNEGYLKNNFSWLFWTPNYNTYFQQVVADNNALSNNANGNTDVPEELEQRINYVLGNRDYLIPVFNRKEKAVFNFLVEDNSNGSGGLIFPSIVHKSVKFTEKNNDEKQAFKDIWKSVLIGVICVAAILSLVVYANSTQTSLIILSAIIGMSYSLIGVGILFAYRRIYEFFK